MASKYRFLDKREEAQKQSYVQQLIFGPGGVGKTTYLGSAAYDPRTSPILVLDLDGGGRSLKGIPAELGTVFPIRDWDDYQDAYEYLASGESEYKSCAIDSTTETHIYSLLNIVELAVEADIKANGSKAKRIDDTKIQEGDYGQAMTMLRRFLREFRKLPMHTFYTALTKTENEPKEGYVKKPAMFGQMSEELVGMFSVCSYLTMGETGNVLANGEKEVARYLVLGNTPSIRAKTRTPWMTEIPDIIRIGQDNGVTLLFDVLQEPMPIDQ